MHRSRPLLPLLAAALGLAGCSHLVTGADGTRHVAGCMVLTLPPAGEPVGADVLRMRTLGLALLLGQASDSHIGLGWTDVTAARVRNDSLVTQGALQRAIGAYPSPEKH